MKVPNFTKPLLALFASVFLLGYGRAQSFPPAWKTTSTYVTGDIVQKTSNFYRAIAAVPVGKDPSSAYTYWELQYVRANTTLLIGVDEPFVNFAVAWRYIRNARVSDAAYLHLYISSSHGVFTESFGGALSLDHISGSRISIIGDFAPHVAFLFPNATDGLTIDTNHTFARVSGLTIEGFSGSSTITGIRADTGGCIGSIDLCTIDFFQTSVVASHNANLTITGTGILNFAIAGFQADSGGTLKFPAGQFIDGPGGGLSIGLLATDGGQITARQSTISNCATAVKASTGGTIDVQSSSISGCVSGCYAEYRGFIDGTSGTYSNNQVYDLSAYAGGIVRALLEPNAKAHSGGAADGSYVFH